MHTTSVNMTGIIFKVVARDSCSSGPALGKTWETLTYVTDDLKRGITKITLLAMITSNYWAMINIAEVATRYTLCKFIK